MHGNSYVILEDRGIIGITGDDRIKFLQGLVSNDMRKVTWDCAIHAAFLTPQGKYLHDFFAVQNGNELWLDCERARLPDLMKRLSLYKVRSKINLHDLSGELMVIAVIGVGCCAFIGLGGPSGHAMPFNQGVAFIDPRFRKMGARVILPRGNVQMTFNNVGCALGSREHYDILRIKFGLPDGSRDLTVEKAILLENGFAEMGSIDWNKGCYIGQELTARMKHRNLIKKRLIPVKVKGSLPVTGTPLMQNGKEIGEIKSGSGTWALALLRLDALEKDAPIRAGKVTIIPHKSEWAKS